MKGQLIVTGQVGDSTVMLKSKRLLITLDYETADLVIRLNRKTLRGENKSLPPANEMVHAQIIQTIPE